ncbi:MAG: hypothetical protein OXK79_10095 [Chloroflexota bacterium]|nr:hypothetical protein [Chloroflexota bacterium]
MKEGDYERVELDGWLRFDDRPAEDTATGPARRVEVQGRCYRCWGPIAGLLRRDGRCVHVECLVCGVSATDGDAEAEVTRMLREAEANVPLARVGRGSKYSREARFVAKLLADMDRDAGSYEHAVAASLRSRRRKGYVDRHDFPRGHAGYLFAQAGMLVSGLGLLPRELSAVSMSDVEFGAPEIQRVEPTGEDDGSVRVEGIVPGGYRRPSNEVLKARMGTLMMAGLTAAFACELAMKALLITRCHAARKKHDLALLYAALPPDCRERLEGDFGEIGSVLEENRETFGDWRYFQQAKGESAFGALVDTDRLWGLSKSARVLIDECVAAGLDYNINATKDCELRSEGGELDYRELVHLEVEGRESAIAWEGVRSATVPTRLQTDAPK